MPLLIILIGYASTPVFMGFLTLGIYLCLLEFNRMGLGDDSLVEQHVAAVCGGLVAPVMYWGNTTLLLPLLTVAMFILFLLFLF